MKYLVLIGDICDSRHVSDRGALQNTLEASLANLNQKYTQSILSPYTITLGDEFQAVLTSATDLWSMVMTIQAKLYPTRVRFGFGVGGIATRLNRQVALGMDGPAFHHAREAIDLLKEQGGLYRIHGLPDPLLSNHALTLLSGLQEKWKQPRFRVFAHYLMDAPVEDIAIWVGVSKVAVYKNINDGMLATWKALLEAVVGEINGALGVQG